MKKKQNNPIRLFIKSFALISTFVGVSVFASLAFATNMGIGDIASRITKSFEDIARLILAVGYVAGIGFAVAAVFKFKQHKDNPTQIPIGTPVALIAISASLIFLASFIEPLGVTLGVQNPKTGTAGARGTSAAIPGLEKP